MKHHRRAGSSGAGREFKKPTDLRRQEPDDLHTLTYAQLKRRGKITEQVTRGNKSHYNIVLKNTKQVRSVTLLNNNQKR